MKRIADALYKSFGRIELIFVFLFCIALALSVAISIFRTPEIVLAGFYVFFCSICILITCLMRKMLKNANIWARAVFVMGIAFVIRAIACYFLNLTQQGDYGIYLSVANKISSGSFTKNIYYGIFPHALNYPIFISGIYKFIGSFTWIPQLVNLIFGVIEVGCVVGIAEKSVNPRFGLAAGLAVALNPSIIIFTLFAGGEPLYGALTMAALLCFVCIYKSKKKLGLPFAVLAGFLSSAANFFRPTGVVFIIAALIIFAVFDRDAIKARVLRSVAVIASYALVVFVLGFLTFSVNGYEKPSPSYGWNLFVGANDESEGHWNMGDAELFNKKIKEYDNPSDLQKYFADLGYERYYEMKTGIPAHFVKKLTMWFDESFVVNSVTKWQNDYTRFKSVQISQTYKLICFFYNFIIGICAMLAMILMGLSKKAPLGFKLLSFYILGSMTVFMILEAAARYKGAYYGILTLLGVYGAFMIYEKVINDKYKRIL